ncbi:hypothetical protein GOBAR_DD07259 [Gossypium barbadense]|nr:hypothetical protein GOBAR_DD07259 [Gossypium barbadense]
MSFLFGKRKTPAELLRENKRMLDKSIREIERERQGLQTQEKKLIAEIKKSAKQGQMGAVKVMAKDLIRTRHQIEKFFKLKSQLQGVSLRIQMEVDGYNCGGAITKTFDICPAPYHTLKSTQAMGEAMKGDEEEEETEELVSQVLDEIGIDINQELVNAPSAAVAAPAANGKIAQVEATGNGDSGIDSDLQARLDNLRRM